MRWTHRPFVFLRKPIVTLETNIGDRNAILAAQLSRDNRVR